MGAAGQSVTLANSIIGVGILAMPFCFQQCGVVLATLILLFMGLISRLCCYFLLKSALIARRRNFEFLAFHVFGPAGKLAVEVGIIGFLMGTCIAYFVVVGDLGPQIIAKMFNINQSDILRTSIMVIVSLVCILPLGLLRNVDSLSNVSAATIGFYFCLVIKVISEAASCMWRHEWQSAVQLWRPAGLLQCVPIFSMALFCQTQLFEIFESLPTLSLEKMNVVTKNAINICTGVYFTLGLFGYIAFHSHNISGNILMSLSPTMASDVIKLGFVMSVAFSFPLIIFPCRASMYSFLYKKIHAAHHDHIINSSIPETTFRCITVAIIAVALFISLLIPNIELVLGLVGSTIGVLVCVVFPAACFVTLTFKDTNERVLAKGVIILGLVILILGTYANLQAAETKVDRYDDKITPERIDKIVQDFFERMEHKDAVRPGSKENVNVASHEKVNKLDVKDSEIQPPNPVPPDSNSNSIEKHLNEIKLLETNENKKIEPKLVLVENIAEKASATHPKNLQSKLNDAKINNELKQLKPDEKTKEEAKSVQDKTQEKIDIMKQQKLIETIKQHGEEQKELIKEQKEILNELVKAKKSLKELKDLEQKKDTETVDAKKLAVESIQKIADVAIKTLSGVTEIPKGGKKDESSEVLDKIADEAMKAIEAIAEINNKETVKEENKNIRQNAVNTGDSGTGNAPNILSIGDNNLSAQNNFPLQNPQIIMPAVQHVQNAQNNIPNSNSQSNTNNFAPVNSPVAQIKNVNAQVIPHNEAVVLNENIAAAQNVQQPKVDSNIVRSVEVGQNVKSVNNVPASMGNPNQIGQARQPNQQNNQGEINKQIKINNEEKQAKFKQEQNQLPNINVPQPNIEPGQNEMKQMNNEEKQAKFKQEQNQLPNINVPQPNIETAQNEMKQNVDSKLHSHSPDEPQSYKLGEDLQTGEMAKNVAENIPIPIAMNGKSKAKQIQTDNINEETNDAIKSLHDVKNGKQNVENGAKDNLNDVEMNAGPVRQKRELVDCTKRSSLPPEDKEICNALVDNNVAKNENIDTPIEMKIEPQVKGFVNNAIGNNNKIEMKATEILPSKVDLNEGLNLLPIGLIHHGRSLKSYDENERKR